MKKILFLMAFTLLSFYGMGQNAGTTVLLASYNIASHGDTLIIFNSIDMEKRSYAWRMDVTWSGLTGTLDGTIIPKVSALPDSLLTSALYTTYPDMTATTLSVAAGSTAFEDYTFLGRKMGLYIDKNNISGGIIKVIITFKN